MKITPSMETLTHDKMKKIEHKLENIYEDMKSFRVVLNSAPLDKFEVRIHGNVHGKEYFTDELAFTLEHALVAAVDELERILEKDKIVSTSEDWKQAREAKRFDPDKSPQVGGD